MGADDGKGDVAQPTSGKPLPVGVLDLKRYLVRKT